VKSAKKLGHGYAMINYKNLKKLFWGKDIEYIKSTLDMLINKTMTAKLCHKLKKILRYYILRNKQFNIISRQKRKLKGDENVTLP